MPSAGRTSMPRRGPAPLTSTFDVTLRVAGSMITIDLPSTSPIIQPAAWAPLAPKLDAASAPVSASTLSFPNMMCSLARDPRMPERQGARADAGSYAGELARMQAWGRFLMGDRHVTVRIGGHAPPPSAPSAQHSQHDREKS